MTQDVLSQGAEPRRRLPQINPVYILVVVLILAIVVMNPAFGEPTGYMNYLKRVAALAILSGGALYVIISGGFDLSVGSTMTLTVIGSSMLASNDPNSTYWIIPLMLGIGVVIGVINGLVVSYLKVPSLIATLGMMISLNGVAFMWSGGAPRGYLPDTFRFFGRYNIADLPVISILPIAVICLVVFGAILWWRQPAGGAPCRRSGGTHSHLRLRRLFAHRSFGGCDPRRPGRRFGQYRLGFRIAGHHGRGDRGRTIARWARLGARHHRWRPGARSHLHPAQPPGTGAAGPVGGAGTHSHRCRGFRHLSAATRRPMSAGARPPGCPSQQGLTISRGRIP